MLGKPRTMKEQVDQLWYAIIGTNGEGLLGRFDKFIDTRSETCPMNIRESVVERNRALKREQLRNRIMVGSLFVAVASLTFTIIITLGGAK